MGNEQSRRDHELNMEREKTEQKDKELQVRIAEKEMQVRIAEKEKHELELKLAHDQKQKGI